MSEEYYRVTLKEEYDYDLEGVLPVTVGDLEYIRRTAQAHTHITDPHWPNEGTLVKSLLLAANYLGAVNNMDQVKEATVDILCTLNGTPRA